MRPLDGEEKEGREGERFGLFKDPISIPFDFVWFDLVGCFVAVLFLFRCSLPDIRNLRLYI